MMFMQQLGNATGAVVGNILTMAVTVGLLYITKADATNSTFMWFVILLYGGYPFTVLSQLTTGPMVDAVCPPERKGEIQGYGNAIMAIVGPLASVILGNVADNKGTEFCIWTCITISGVAALSNVPLMAYPQLMWAKDPNAKPDHEHDEDFGTDDELAKRAESGQWIPAADLARINEARMTAGQPFLKLPVGKYKDDADYLGKLKKRAVSEFAFQKKDVSEWTAKMNGMSREELQGMVEAWKASSPDEAYQKARAKELGEWFADYLLDNGW